MKNLDITYEKFEKHLEAIVRNMQFQEGLIDLFIAYNRDTGDACELMLPMMVDNVIDLLTIATRDDDGWISYWLFDLECGKAYKDGMITHADGSIIKLQTISDLWALLISD